MPNNKDQEKAQADYQKLVDRANTVLTKEGVDVGAQLVLVMGDGQRVPVQAITAQPLVMEKQDESKSKVENSGKNADDKPVPEQTK